MKRFAGEGASWASAIARSRRSSLTGDTTKGLGSDGIQWLGTRKSGIVSGPESGVLLPWKSRKEVIFRIDVVTKRT